MKKESLFFGFTVVSLLIFALYSLFAETRPVSPVVQESIAKSATEQKTSTVDFGQVIGDPIQKTSKVKSNTFDTTPTSPDGVHEINSNTVTHPY